MTRLQLLNAIKIRFKRFDRANRKLIREVLRWIHLLLVILLLRCFSDHILETLIIVMFMYEVGFEFTAIDKLMEYNNRFRSWVVRKFSARRKK